METPEYPQMEFTQNEPEPERRERATDILGNPNLYCCSRNGETVCEERTESSRPIPQSQSNCDETRPKNTPLTEKQLMCLRRAFMVDSTPKQESYTALAKELGLSVTNVWHWFYNERSKVKTKTKITSPYLFPNSKQLETLGKSFLKDNSPSKKSIQILSKKLRLKEITVHNWFSNMRRRAQFPHKGECASNFNESNSEIGNTMDSILCELPDRSNARKKLGLDRSKRKILNKDYSENNRPSHEHMQEWAKQLNIPFRQVYLWFYDDEGKGENKICNQYRIKKTNGFSSPTEPNINEDIRGKRNFLSLKQLSILKVEFVKNCYPSIDYQKTIAKKLDLKECQVTNWFKAVRQKMSRANLEWKSRSDRQKILLTISTKRTTKVDRQEHRQINKRLLTSGVGSFKQNHARSYLNKDQLEILRNHYLINKKPSPECLKDLSKQLGLPYIKLYTWFTNRRQRDRTETPPETVCSLYSGNLDKDGYNNSKPGNNYLKENQLSCLKDEFVANCYPSKEWQKLLSTQLGLRERTVYNWFSAVRRKMLRAKLSINNKAARQRILATISTKIKQKDNQQECPALLNSGLGEYTNKDHSHEQLKEVSSTLGEPYQSRFKTHRQTEETPNQSGNGRKRQVNKCSSGLNRLKSHKRSMVSKANKCFLYSYQLSGLKEAFVENGNLPTQGRERVARELGLYEIKVAKWFSDARRKMVRAKLNVNKREHREKIVTSYRNICRQQ